ncbi:unnamed protein product [Protopolystoma xenopodis]|uniref:Uncharacterized protein n=1 Tax=Protopolystoma xenopodis TaxID=117903 RepID=A0A448WR89_9PLAT|nr:unnamed protein product [Protopolystoma xenopodis]
MSRSWGDRLLLQALELEAQLDTSSALPTDQLDAMISRLEHCLEGTETRLLDALATDESIYREFNVTATDRDDRHLPLPLLVRTGIEACLNRIRAKRISRVKPEFTDSTHSKLSAMLQTRLLEIEEDTPLIVELPGQAIKPKAVGICHIFKLC